MRNADINIPTHMYCTVLYVHEHSYRVSDERDQKLIYEVINMFDIKITRILQIYFSLSSDISLSSIHHS
jgi:hypothetical protein